MHIIYRTKLCHFQIRLFLENGSRIILPHQNSPSSRQNLDLHFSFRASEFVYSPQFRSEYRKHRVGSYRDDGLACFG